MYCPKCGVEELKNTPYCRSCGTGLSGLRGVIAHTDNFGTASGTRNEIAKAFVTKIEGLSSAKDLKKITEDVLPEINKFLETPEESRLRRIRQGSLISFVGLGATIGFGLVSVLVGSDLIIMSGFGLITLFIGLAYLINGFFFTLPAKDGVPGEFKAEEPGLFNKQETNELVMPDQPLGQFSSVVENTTRALNEKIPVAKDADLE